jgi:hypothetical protein
MAIDRVRHAFTTKDSVWPAATLVAAAMFQGCVEGQASVNSSCISSS